MEYEKQSLFPDTSVLHYKASAYGVQGTAQNAVRAQAHAPADGRGSSSDSVHASSLSSRRQRILISPCITRAELGCLHS
eukprot:1159538-Pelagomonas_calceolata.AAC.7